MSNIDKAVAKYRTRLERRGAWRNHTKVEYMSTAVAAEKWGVSDQTVRNWADEGKIAGIASLDAGKRDLILIPVGAEKPE